MCGREMYEVRRYVMRRRYKVCVGRYICGGRYVMRKRYERCVGSNICG